MELGARSAPPPIGPQPGPECRACVCGGGLQRSLPPSQMRVLRFPPSPASALQTRRWPRRGAFPSGCPPPPPSREGPAHSSMSEPQPGRAQRQGRRGGRAGAGLRHPGRVSSQVPPRTGRGAPHARPTESAAGAFAGGGKRPACLRMRMRQTGRALLAAGGAVGGGAAGGNATAGASGGTASKEHLRVRPAAAEQRLRPLSMGRVSEAALLECGGRRSLARSSRPAWQGGGRGRHVSAAGPPG